MYIQKMRMSTFNKEVLKLWQNLLKNNSLIVISIIRRLHREGYQAQDIIKEILLFYHNFVKTRFYTGVSTTNLLSIRDVLQLQSFLLKLESQTKFSYFADVLLEINLLIFSNYLRQNSSFLIEMNYDESVLNYIWQKVIINLDIFTDKYFFFEKTKLITLANNKAIIEISSIMLLRVIRDKVVFIRKELESILGKQLEIQIKLNNCNFLFNHLKLSNLTLPTPTYEKELANLYAFSNIHEDYIEMHYITQLLTSYYYSI